LTYCASRQEGKAVHLRAPLSKEATQEGPRVFAGTGRKGSLNSRLPLEGTGTRTGIKVLVLERVVLHKGGPRLHAGAMGLYHHSPLARERGGEEDGSKRGGTSRS